MLYDNIIAMTENLFKSLPGTFIESKNPHQKIRRVLGIDPGLANTGFGIVDFYNYVDMLPLDESVLKSYMSDQIHPNFLGYQWMASKFQKYLLERYQNKYPGYTIPVKEY